MWVPCHSGAGDKRPATPGERGRLEPCAELLDSPFLDGVNGTWSDEFSVRCVAALSLVRVASEIAMVDSRCKFLQPNQTIY